LCNLHVDFITYSEKEILSRIEMVKKLQRCLEAAFTELLVNSGRLTMMVVMNLERVGSIWQKPVLTYATVSLDECFIRFLAKLLVVIEALSCPNQSVALHHSSKLHKLIRIRHNTSRKEKWSIGMC